MISWNAHGLFINDTIRRRRKLNFLFKTLFKHVDVLCLQEAHLAPRSFALAKKAAVKMGFKFFGVPGDQAVGGVACFCRCSFLETHFQFVEWQEWEPGRHAYLKCFGERGNAVFHDVHFEPNDIPRRKKQISQLRTTLDTFSQHCNFVMGDFNFVMDEVDRMSYGTGHSHSSNNSNDIAFQDLWRAKFGNLTDVSQQDNFTRFGSDGCARLDRVYVTGSLFPSSLFRVKSSVYGEGRNYSDHLPVLVTISRKKSQGPSNKIPKWICQQERFRVEMELCVQRDGMPDNPWEALERLKTYMHMAAKEVRSSFKHAPAPEDCKLIWFCRTFRAIQTQDIKQVGLCCIKVPELKS